MKPPSPGLLPGLNTLATDAWIVGVVLLVVATVAVVGWVREQVGEFSDVFRRSLSLNDEPQTPAEPEEPSEAPTGPQRAQPYPGFDWSVYDRSSR